MTDVKTPNTPGWWWMWSNEHWEWMPVEVWVSHFASGDDTVLTSEYGTVASNKWGGPCLGKPTEEEGSK